MNLPPAIEISGIQKTYPHQTRPALKGINLVVAGNERIGIVGANGSGKTTLFRMILNLIHPDQGEIRIMGSTDLESAKTDLGFIPEHQAGLENFTPAELLSYAARMSGIPEEKRKSRSEELLKWTGLENRRDELLGGFSKGMVQRVQLALALVHHPKIILLDEPMSGLDPGSQKSLNSLLRNLGEYTMLYASHNLAEIEELCQRVVIFHEGEIIRDIKLAEQKSEIYTIESEPAILTVLRNFPGIELRAQWGEGASQKIEIIAEQNQIRDFLAACKQNDVGINRLRSRSVLEELYDKYVSLKQ